MTEANRSPRCTDQRMLAQHPGDCPACGQLILIGDPVYLIPRKRKHKRARRFICGACAWRRLMKDHPKYNADGWPARWARSA